MDGHKEHIVMESGEVFEAVKNDCDALTDKGLETVKLIQEKSTKIQGFSKLLSSAHQTKNIAVFKLMDELSTLLDSSNTMSDTGETGAGITSGQAVTNGQAVLHTVL